ncbi:cofactor-independent phosphoglycerate mutase [bacterium B13(2017)]|nr:cofactor-independent phosphoglycerate mutase [bacterium B13(2017)]
MKHVLIIPDGMGDLPTSELNGKTPVEQAETPHLDEISKNGHLGLCYTTPSGFPPGSDICILSLIGYDPEIYYSGRAPLEAASLNINMNPEDVIFRCNLINLGPNQEIQDHSAGHISTEESREIILTLSEELGTADLEFFPGVSYRNILVLKNKPNFKCDTTPPHDVPGQNYKDNLPHGKDAKILNDLMSRSIEILKDHPVNIQRKCNNKATADMIWLWGGGYKPNMDNFYSKYGVKGAVISAVDLIKGLAKVLDLDVLDVPGITAYFDTDYSSKGQYAAQALKKYDLVIVHIEAPDEAGHVGNVKEKIKAIENIDKYIIGPVYKHLSKEKEFRIMISPDHYTPVEKRIHMNYPVPFVICGKNIPKNGIIYSEKNAKKSELIFLKGYELMSYFLK